MYGCSPNGEEETKFKQVMSLYTKVAMIKKYQQEIKWDMV